MENFMMLLWSSLQFVMMDDVITNVHYENGFF